jgi:hypothetical protein
LRHRPRRGYPHVGTRMWVKRDDANLMENVQAQNQLLLAVRSGEGAIHCDRRPSQRPSVENPARLPRICCGVRVPAVLGLPAILNLAVLRSCQAGAKLERWQHCVKLQYFEHKLLV